MPAPILQSMKSSLVEARDGNEAGSGWVAPIPNPFHLFEIIHIPVPFKKLNGAGRDGRV